MTQGKNPRNFKKKGLKKKLAHPFIKKEWFNIMAPVAFETRNASLSPANKTAGQRNYTENLKNRVYSFNLADLNENHNMKWRNIQLQIEEIKDQDCYTGFYGMSTTRDKICQLVKKWQSLIESFVQVKTKDGYLLRVFAMGFTARRRRQVKATCYAKNSQSKAIKKKMQEIMIAEVQKHNLKDLVKVLVGDTIGDQIKKDCNKIFPLDQVLVTKVKLLKKPKYDYVKFMENYQETSEQKAKRAPKAEGEAKNKLA